MSALPDNRTEEEVFAPKLDPRICPKKSLLLMLLGHSRMLLTLISRIRWDRKPKNDMKDRKVVKTTFRYKQNLSILHISG